jgi:uncharacterized membrane protein
LLVETILATVALSLSKQPYVLAAALLLVPAWKHRRAIAAPIVAALVVSAGLALGWAHWANNHYLAPDFLPPALGGQPNYANNNVQPSAQIKRLRHDPFAFVGIVGRTVTHHGVSIAHDLVAQITFWHAPGVIAVLVAAGLVAVVVVDSAPLPGGNAMRALTLVLAAVIVGVSLVLAYVGWNALSAPRIDGYQGRYLLLVLGMVALVVFPDRRRARPRSPRAIAGIATYLVGWSALMLLAVETGLAWHSYA